MLIIRLKCSVYLGHYICLTWISFKLQTKSYCQKLICLRPYWSALFQEDICEKKYFIQSLELYFRFNKQSQYHVEKTCFSKVKTLTWTYLHYKVTIDCWYAHSYHKNTPLCFWKHASPRVKNVKHALLFSLILEKMKHRHQTQASFFKSLYC